MRARSGVQRGFSRLSDRIGGVGFVSQYVTTDPSVTSYTVPVGASWVFAEAVGRGGGAGGDSSYRAGGAAGSDAIFQVSPAEALSLTLSPRPSSGTTPISTAISYQAATKVTAASAAQGNSSAGAGAAGKYPGGNGNGTFGGPGGGRLGGIGTDVGGAAPGIGAGACGANSLARYGGVPCICLTFFDSYDAALAFAKACYGGSWSP